MDKSKEKKTRETFTKFIRILQFFNIISRIISHSRNLSHIMERTSLIAVYVFFIVLDIVV